SFSPEGGLYAGGQMISISSDAGSAIYYTTDGSIPTTESTVYKNPININGTEVFRAKVFHDNMLPSEVVTHTYIVDEPSTLPVISITTPPEFLWDEEIGITMGICVSDDLGAPPPFDPNANFWNRWERPVHIEYYTPEGDPGFKQDAGIAIFGGLFGRQIRQKAFTLYARDKYGDADFDFPLFPTKPINSFKRFLIRCSSNDFNRTYIRDAMMNSLVIGQMDIDYQAYQPAIVYINGNFWGLYNIREKTNQYYPESNYGIGTDLVDLIEGIDNTAHGDGTHYQDLIQFVQNNDMTLPENYQYVQTQMDVVEYMNYYITEIYVCNRDWLHQNIKCWRERSNDGKWRWLLYDMDWGFSGEYHLGPDQFTDNTIQWVLEQGPSSILFQRLIRNSDFKAEFAQRFITHMNLTFNPDRVHHIISSMVHRLEPEMPRQIERWGAIQNIDYWNEELAILHNFAQERPIHMDIQLTETLMPEEKGEFILEVSNGEAGWISVYDAPVPVPVFAGQWYRKIPLKIRAHPKPGWRFVRWEGFSESQNDHLTISLTDNAVLHAVFDPYELPSIVISEIHYNPSSDLQGDDVDFEFVELVNSEESQIDISGYQLTGGIELIFPPGSYMEAGEYIIVAKNAETYATRDCQVFQVSSGKLDNAGEEVSLYDNNAMIVDQVNYDDHYPWPRKPDGEGPSLELKDPSLDNILASSWKESEHAGGTPGTGNITGVEDINPISLQNILLNIWPNPIEFITSIEYSVPEESRITIKVFNSFGQEVRQLASGTRKPGTYNINWEPGNLPTGIYFIQVSCGRYSQTEKVLYLNGERSHL
ncbi:MAG: CotH kinase family protein, partial [Bacteroidales bacterium]|nr:CotH kinase family protein [Bacteroidales bacterium]